ncbi:MAG TPA: rhodanese-like domain-containing protein [Steroidobacteraceae bacterium]|nr:rhodanese-like domain-containing protein [Steroidobacteraceae bacterium]
MDDDMKQERLITVDGEELKRRYDLEKPDNEDRLEGYALVNVLGPESHAKEHIPCSINIPKGQEDEFERRFDKDKEIVVYCASFECDASPTVASRLAERGFTKVRDYEGGIGDWKISGNRVEP